jgi:predicted nucleotidyltransferase
MDLERVLLRLTTALQEAEIDFALIGGLALAAHGAARATADLDLLAEGERDADVHRILLELGYECLHRTPDVANYAGSDPARGRADFLFARQRYGKAMLARAVPHPVLGLSLKVVDAADLIGLKVQASSNDATRRHRDLADIQSLLRVAPGVDLARVREYFRLFDREKELDALLEEARR